MSPFVGRLTATSDRSEMTTIIVGASRGLGRGITDAFAGTRAPVIAVAEIGGRWLSGRAAVRAARADRGRAERGTRASTAGARVIAAGMYELTPLKQHFRRRCPQSVLSGFKYGLCCVGSSIGLMLMLMAVRVMSIGWMSVIAAPRSSDLES